MSGPRERFFVLATDLEALPVPLRGLLLGAVALGIVGGVLGLVLGLMANASTAWFAVAEVGFPAAILGGVIGLAVGAVISAVIRTSRT